MTVRLKVVIGCDADGCCQVHEAFASARHFNGFYNVNFFAGPDPVEGYSTRAVGWHFDELTQTAKCPEHHVLVGEVCHHSWEADEDGVRCCVHCGVTDERDRS